MKKSVLIKALESVPGDPDVEVQIHRGATGSPIVNRLVECVRVSESERTMYERGSVETWAKTRAKLLKLRDASITDDPNMMVAAGDAFMRPVDSMTVEEMNDEINEYETSPTGPVVNVKVAYPRLYEAVTALREDDFIVLDWTEKSDVSGNVTITIRPHFSGCEKFIIASIYGLDVGKMSRWGEVYKHKITELEQQTQPGKTTDKE